MAFNKPNPKQNFYELEQSILQFWKEKEILDKSIEHRPEDNIKTFYDGPITANGEPHTGHMLTFSLKDLIPRYWTMKGYRVERSLGWDCHGIPVEYEVEKKLGFKEKKDIEKYGIKEFNALCKESVIKYQKNIIDLEEKIGRLTNDTEEYATMDASFIESVWWSLKELYEKDLLYEGFKVVPYSTRAGTTLSNAEVALGGYKPMVDPAITVKFQLEEETDTYLLAWTTTPWTIPSNLGLAVNNEIHYAKVKHEGAFYILAKARIEEVFKDMDYEVEGNVDAKDLVGKSYIPPFDFFTEHTNAHVIFNAAYVTTDEGTGIVHLAPYGAEDNEVFQEHDIASFDVLDDQGDFTEQITPYAGMFYRKANKYIIEDLRNNNRLFKHEDYEHDMPMCWRTKTPLIYKPIESWYVAMSQLRERLVDLNATINWIPKHVREGRFGNWLAEIKDWSISRKRYWGTPLPVWKSESGKIKIIGSFSELEELSGQKIEDPHRPFVDEISFFIEGEIYYRIPDVIDVWYDSGAMPFARLHYPFDNQEAFAKKSPAQYIAEGIDQTRGWFYTLHAEAVALFDRVGYENVIINGTITDDKGRKLSKSLGNYTPPTPLIEEFGADSIRLNFFDSPLMYGEDSAVTQKTIKENKQETILPLWNMFSYLITYANIHNWQPDASLAYNERNVTSDSHPWDHIPFDDIENNTDAWVIMLLQKTIQKVSEEIDAYTIQKATKAIKDFISEVSKWYIRSNRERFANGDTQALATLYYVLIEVCKLLAPFAPFITEYIYQELVVNEVENPQESIHLCDYPEYDTRFMEEYSMIIEEMKLVRDICELGHMLRSEKQIKVRQPLQKVEVKLTHPHISALSEWMERTIANELNVKEVLEVITLENANSKIVSQDKSEIQVGLETALTPELEQEGLVREITRNVQAMRKKMKLQLKDTITLSIISPEQFVQETMSTHTEEIQNTVNATKINVSDHNRTVPNSEGEILAEEALINNHNMTIIIHKH